MLLKVNTKVKERKKRKIFSKSVANFKSKSKSKSHQVREVQVILGSILCS